MVVVVAKMKIGLAHTKPCENQRIVYEAFREGLAANYDSYIDILGFDDIKKIDHCDAVVMISYPDIVELGYKFCDETHYPRESRFWSIINTFRGEVYKKCVESRKRILCIDSGVLGFRRGQGQDVGDNIYQVGWDKIKGLGNYYNNNSPSDRWEKLGFHLADWTYDGVHIIIFGQVQYGVGSQHVSIKQWYRDSINKILNVSSERRIVIRLHPNCQDDPFPVKTLNLKFTKGHRKLSDDVEKAFCTISFSSHSIVQSVIYGRPSFSCSKLSMGYPLFHIDNLSDIFARQNLMPERSKVEQWLNDLCYTQWAVSEIKQGLCWNHLRPYTLRIEDAGFDNMLSEL
jgi:hypothetical protein